MPNPNYNKGARLERLARLELEFPGLKNASYLVEQDLQQAITTGRFTQAGATLLLETMANLSTTSGTSTTTTANSAGTLPRDA